MDELLEFTPETDFLSILDDADLTTCLHWHPGFDDDALLETPIFDSNAPLWHPFHFEMIRRYQLNDAGLKQWVQNNPPPYIVCSFNGNDLLFHLNAPLNNGPGTQ